jgi:hypothetical protein
MHCILLGGVIAGTAAIPPIFVRMTLRCPQTLRKPGERPRKRPALLPASGSADRLAATLDVIDAKS